MNPPAWLEVLYMILKNFPSIVLDTREFTVEPGQETVKKGIFTTVQGDFRVDIRAVNKSGAVKTYKVITFITDL